MGDTHSKAVADVYSKMTSATKGKNTLLSELDEVILYSLRTKSNNTWYSRDDAKESGEKYAYIGVTRTDSRNEALYGLLILISDKKWTKICEDIFRKTRRRTPQGCRLARTTTKYCGK